MIRLVKPAKIEWISYCVMMPGLALVLTLLFFKGRVWRELDIWLYSFPLVMVIGFVSWYVHVWVMYWLRERLPGIAQTPLRLTVLGFSHIGLTFFTFVFLFYLYDAWHLFGYYLEKNVMYKTLFIAIAFNMVITTFWEAEFTMQQVKSRLVEKEKLQQLTLLQEFEGLKSQVNPHFLFNCFNTLSSLISEDTKMAEHFVNELSKVYRYLLRDQNESVSTLHNELRFIESYFALMQCRHGDAVQLQLEIDKRYVNYVLPSLSLQLLVENAMKHNIVSKQSPLVIDIFTTAGNILVVNNNLQPKQVMGASNHVGIKNIQSKYDLLKQSGFQVIKDEKNFSVILPLIWNAGYADNNNNVYEPHLKPLNATP